MEDKVKDGKNLIGRWEEKEELRLRLSGRGENLRGGRSRRRRKIGKRNRRRGTIGGGNEVNKERLKLKMKWRTKKNLREYENIGGGKIGEEKSGAGRHGEGRIAD